MSRGAYNHRQKISYRRAVRTELNTGHAIGNDRHIGDDEQRYRVAPLRDDVEVS